MAIKTSILKMQKLKNNIYEISIITFATICCIVFFYCHGNISTDVGREVMMPLSILNGEVLYKDILNIYAPASYYINAIFMLIFGAKLESLYIAGSLCSIIFLLTFFKLSEKFFNKNLSLTLTLFVSLTCVYNSRLYNFILPYSYAVIYGLTAYTISLYFLLEYQDKKDAKNLYLSSVFAGLAFANKIEFLPIILITHIVSLISKEKIKNIALSISVSIIPSILFYSIPFIQGMTIKEALYAIEIFKKSSIVPSVVDFAKQTGAIFRPEDIIFWIASILLLSLFLILAIALFKTGRNKILLFVAIAITSLLHFMSKGETHFTYLPILMSIIVIFNYRKLIENPKILILTIGAIFASLKTFFYLNTDEYGAFTLPLLILAGVAVIGLFEKQISEKLKVTIPSFLAFILISATISNVIYSYQQLKLYNTPITTEFGRIDTREDWAKSSEQMLKFISENSTKNDKILFLQEGSLFNFLSGRKTDMRLYALNLPYIETYGEDKICEMIDNFGYKYVVILDGFGLYDFNKPKYYLSENKITKYLKSQFKPVWQLKTNTDSIIILENLK